MKFPEQYRMTKNCGNYNSNQGDQFGLFVVHPGDAPEKRAIRMIAAGEYKGWEHVSVSISDMTAGKRTPTPTWEEMCFVKSLFWDESETCFQFHPAKKDYVNFHSGVLHVWRKVGEELPMPPKECV